MLQTRLAWTLQSSCLFLPRGWDYRSVSPHPEKHTPFHIRCSSLLVCCDEASGQKQLSFFSELPGHTPSLKKSGQERRAEPKAGAVEELSGSLPGSSQFLIQRRTLVWGRCHPRWPGPSCTNNSQHSPHGHALTPA